MVQVEKTKHAELERCVGVPIRLDMEYCNGVDVVNDDLHGKEGQEEANGIASIAFTRDTRHTITLLGNVVIEGENRAGIVERGIQSICHEIAE